MGLEPDLNNISTLLKLTEPSKEQREETARREKLSHINPDGIWLHKSTACLTFIYKDGKLLIAPNITHFDLARKNGFRDNTVRRTLMEDGYLLGRIAEMDGYQIVSFWNNTENNPELSKCLKVLLSRRDITNKAYVVGDWSPVVTVGEIFGNSPSTSPKTSQYPPELLQKMHVLPPGTKKKLMSSSGYRSKVVSTTRPGMKWWAPTSESFREWLRNNS